MLFYVFLFAASQDAHHQSAWGQSFAIWLVLEIIFVSTVLCFLFHILIPSFLFRNVYQVKRKLIESIMKYQETLVTSDGASVALKQHRKDKEEEEKNTEEKENEREKDTDEEEDNDDDEEECGDLSKEKKKTKARVGIQPLSSSLVSRSQSNDINIGMVSFNAAKYLFLSYRLASLYHETKVGKILLSFSSPWPRQSYYYINDISKKYNKRFAAFIRSGTLVLVFLFTNFLTVPLSFQDLLLSFFTTTGIGYYLYLHLLLYDMYPILVVLPDLFLLFIGFLLYKAFVYFVLPSEKEIQIVKHLATSASSSSALSTSVSSMSSVRRFSALHSLRSSSDRYVERNDKQSSHNNKRRRLTSSFSSVPVRKASLVLPLDERDDQQQQQQQETKHISRRLSIQNGIVLLADMEKAVLINQVEETEGQEQEKEDEDERAAKEEKKETSVRTVLTFMIEPEETKTDDRCEVKANEKEMIDSVKEDLLIVPELVENMSKAAETNSPLRDLLNGNESHQVVKGEISLQVLPTREKADLVEPGKQLIMKNESSSSVMKKQRIINEMSRKRVNSWFDIVGVPNVSLPLESSGIQESKKEVLLMKNKEIDETKVAPDVNAVPKNGAVEVADRKVEEKKGGGKSWHELKKADNKGWEEKSAGSQKGSSLAESKESKIINYDNDDLKYQIKRERENHQKVEGLKPLESNLVVEKKDNCKKTFVVRDGKIVLMMLDEKEIKKEKEKKKEILPSSFAAALSPSTSHIVDQVILASLLEPIAVNAVENDDLLIGLTGADKDRVNDASPVFSSEHDESAGEDVVVVSDTKIDVSDKKKEEKEEMIVGYVEEDDRDDGFHLDQFPLEDDDSPVVLEGQHYPSSTDISDFPFHNNHDEEESSSFFSPYPILQNNLNQLPPSSQQSSFQAPLGQSFMLQQPQQPFQQYDQFQHQLQQQFPSSHVAPTIVVPHRKSTKIRRRTTTRKSRKSRLSTLNKQEKPSYHHSSSQSSSDVPFMIKEEGSGLIEDDDDDGSLNLTDFDEGDETDDLSFILDSSSDEGNMRDAEDV
jgi:low affinity Fe/Cu permease